MLKVEDNELITRVGPGTPMGNFMREYWVPAMLSSEVPTPDSDPLRVLLLGEQLIAFRDTNGNVGLIQNHCPHRGASLFFGRNEEAGLRCVYHGWKFDVEGHCIDMPNEPAESDFQDQGQGHCISDTRARRHRLGLPRSARRRRHRCPTSKATCSRNRRQSARATQLPCNWLQVLEGDIDTTHVGFLHYGGLQGRRAGPGQLLRISARGQDGPLRSHRHRGRRRLRRPPTRQPMTRSTGASPSGASRSIRSPRQACSAPRRAAVPACRWTTTTS